MAITHAPLVLAIIIPKTLFIFFYRVTRLQNRIITSPLHHDVFDRSGTIFSKTATALNPSSTVLLTSQAACLPIFPTSQQFASSSLSTSQENPLPPPWPLPLLP